MARCRTSGQSTTETIVLLPFFLLLVFAVLQMAQVATALLVANYAAASIARQVVKDGGRGAGNYQGKFQNLMTAGMRAGIVKVDVESGMLANATVQTCAKINSWPFVSNILNLGWAPQSMGTCSDGLPAIGFNGQTPAHFWVHGRAKARLNYKP